MDLILSFLESAAMTAIKEFIKAWAKEIIKRRKGRTAPTANRDGSKKRK